MRELLRARWAPLLAATVLLGIVMGAVTKSFGTAFNVYVILQTAALDTVIGLAQMVVLAGRYQPGGRRAGHADYGYGREPVRSAALAHWPVPCWEELVLGAAAADSRTASSSQGPSCPASS